MSGAQPRLNKRHKAILFLTLISVGFALLSQLEIRISMGIVLLCLAAAWAIGSNNRIVHALFLVIGLTLIVGLFVVEWLDYRTNLNSYKNEISEFEAKIPEYARKYPWPLQLARWKADVPKRIVGKKMTIQEFSRYVKERYPEYKEVPDRELVRRLLTKFPEFATSVDTHSMSLPARVDAGKPVRDSALGKQNTENSEMDWVDYVKVANWNELEYVLRAIGYDNHELNPIRSELARIGVGSKTLSVQFPIALNAKLPTDSILEFPEVGSKQELALPYPKAKDAQIVEYPLPRDSIIVDFPVGKNFFAPVAEWYLGALAMGVRVSGIPEHEKPGLPPEPLSFGNAENLILIVGFAFMILGIALLVVVRPRIANETTGT